MILFVTVLHLFLCVLLILVILLQPGKGGDVASAFGAGGGGGGSQVFGPRGPAGLLSRATSGIAVLFMVTSITLALNSQDRSRGGSDELDDAVTIEEVEGFGLPTFETKTSDTPSIVLPGQGNPLDAIGAGAGTQEPEPAPIPDEIKQR